MNFNLKKTLLLVVVLTSLSSFYSFSMSRGEKLIFKKLNRIVTNVARAVGVLCNMREIDYSADQSYDDCHDYFDKHREALDNIYKGRNIDDIADGIYRHSDLGRSSDKSIIVNKISETLASFKRKSFRSKVSTLLSTLNKTVAIGAAVFVVWGGYARLVYGDKMGTDYASTGAITLAGTYVLNKLLRFVR